MAPPPPPTTQRWGLHFFFIGGIAYVSSVTGPAEKAGIRPGDVIVGMDDTEIDDLYAFTYALRDHKAGDAVVVKVLRDGEVIECKAVLGVRKK